MHAWGRLSGGLVNPHAEGVRVSFVMLCHVKGVTLSREWPTQPREGEEIEVQQALMPYGRACV